MTLLFASHYTPNPGLLDKLYNFYKKKSSIYLVQYPLYPTSEMKSTIDFGKRKQFKINPIFQFFVESIVTAYWFKKAKKTKPIDIAICFDPLSFFHLYLIKRYLKIDKMIYYNVDFSLKRYRNPIMNGIYQWVNMFAFKQCNYFFCPTKAFTYTLDPEGKYSAKSYVIDHTIDLKEIKKPKARKKSLVYAGTLQYSVNFAKVFKALAKLKKEQIDYHLDIYGDGPLRKDIEYQVQKLHLEKSVTFKGIVPNDKLVHEILPQYQVGICPYIERNDPNARDHMFAGTNITSKIVEYFGAGLPTLTTRLTKKFDEIETNRIGFLPKTSNDWYKRIKVLLAEHKTQQEYRKNAYAYAKQFDMNITLEPIINHILKS